MENITFSLNNITLRVRDRHILENTSWIIRENEHWAIVGPNGSGKTTLARALVDEYSIVKGSTYKKESIRRPHSIGYVSFEQQQDLYRYSELKQHAFSFSGRIQELITAEHVVSAGLPETSGSEIVQEVTSLLGIDHLLKLSMLSLSNGEVRKILIARALAKKPALLILDEPFEGLDYEARGILEESINRIIVEGTTQVILSTHRFEHLSSSISHILCLKDCRVVCLGRKEVILSSEMFLDLYTKERTLTTSLSKPSPLSTDLPSLVSMKNVQISFGGTSVIENFSWEVAAGENWIVAGPNGAGKSTILRLIFGDLPQVYANEITVFGRRRGSGESLWDIRKYIGYVSPEFHMNYRKSIPVLDVVLSGFYDSTGLYRTPSKEEIQAARKWLEAMGFLERENDKLKHFSFGEQRLILLARALVKNPRLLVLDEPLQGLDPENRKLFLQVIEQFGLSDSGAVLYITHHTEEIGSYFTHMMKLYRSRNSFHFETFQLKPKNPQ